MMFFLWFRLSGIGPKEKSISIILGMLALHRRFRWFAPQVPPGKWPLRRCPGCFQFRQTIRIRSRDLAPQKRRANACVRFPTNARKAQFGCLVDNSEFQRTRIASTTYTSSVARLFFVPPVLAVAGIWRSMVDLQA
jgi:hypothetical protein